MLCVDWDLEAPGLHLYFADRLPAEPSKGLVELIQQFADASDPEWRDHVARVRLEEADGALDVMPAGRMDDGYVARLQTLDWERLTASRIWAWRSSGYERSGRAPTTWS